MLNHSANFQNIVVDGNRFSLNIIKMILISFRKYMFN